MTTEELELQTAKLGIEVEAFLHSAVGRYLIERAELEREQAIERLIEADPQDTALQLAIRHDIRVAQSIPDWIHQAIHSGKLATHNLQSMEAAEE